MGIEIINEPNTTTSWPMMNVTERYKAVDPELACLWSNKRVRRHHQI